MGGVDVLDEAAFLDSTRWARCCAKHFAHILLVILTTNYSFYK